MKKLFLLLMFIPLVSFGQDQTDINYSSEKSIINYFDLNPPEDLLEGVWQTAQGRAVILKDENKYNVILCKGDYFPGVTTVEQINTSFGAGGYKYGDTIAFIEPSVSKSKLFITASKIIKRPCEGIPRCNIDPHNVMAPSKITYEHIINFPSRNNPTFVTEKFTKIYNKPNGKGGVVNLKNNEINKYFVNGYRDPLSLTSHFKKSKYITLELMPEKLPFFKVFPDPFLAKKEKKRIKKGEWAGNGSGIIISKSGYIVTNHHVIEGADDIEVEFIINDEVQKFNAEIVQSDKVNDLAIIKIFDMNFDGLDNLSYNFKARSSDVGTKVYAYGYPMALSIMGKEIKVTDGMINSKTGYEGNVTTYQMTAPIQAGNSGGPLFDDEGNFIGINSAGLRKDVADNVGYTIKSSYVLNLIDVLPKTIDLPSSTKLQSLPLTEQIKEISKYVVLVKVK